MLTVAREMDLANNPDFLQRTGSSAASVLDDPAVRQATIHQLQSNLHIAQVPKTDIIRISYTVTKPKAGCGHRQQGHLSLYSAQLRDTLRLHPEVSNWLSGQLDDLKQQVQTSQEQMMDASEAARHPGLRSEPQSDQRFARPALAATNEARISHASLPNRATGCSAAWTRTRSKARSIRFRSGASRD